MRLKYSVLGIIFAFMAIQTRAEDKSDNFDLHWDVATIHWQETAPDGSRYALLSGNRTSVNEQFSYAFAIPAGLWDSPHSHSQDAYVFVAKGTLYLAWGDSNDKARLKAYPEGTMLLVPGGAVHYDGAFEDTIIFGVAKGHWSTTYVNIAEKVSAGTPN